MRNVAKCHLSLISQPYLYLHLAARTLGTQKKAPERSHESPMATHATAPGTGSRLLSFVAKDSREQASTHHGNDMKADCRMLTLMHVSRALKLFEAVH